VATVWSSIRAMARVRRIRLRKINYLKIIPMCMIREIIPGRQQRVRRCPLYKNSKFVKPQYLPTCPDNMVNFGLLMAEICWRVWGHPCKFQRVLRLGSVTARHSSSGRQPNFVALNRWRHLYSARRPSHWHWPTFLIVFITSYYGRPM